MGDDDKIPIVIPVEDTTPHNFCAPPDQFRDGQAVYNQSLPRAPGLVCDNGKGLNRVFANADENIDMSDASVPPDDDIIDVPYGNITNQWMNLVLCIIGGCLGGGIIIIVVALGVPGAAVSVAKRLLTIAITAVTRRIAQYFRQVLDLVLIPGTSTVSLLSYSAQVLCRRPIYRFSARVTVNPISTVTIHIINQQISRRVPVLVLRR